MSKPIIASKIGSIKDLIEDNKTGLLTNNSLKGLVKMTLNLKRNHRVRRNLGLNAREYIEKVGIKQALEKYKSVFST